MVKRILSLIITGAFLMGCQSSYEQICEQYGEICEAFEQQSDVNAFVSLKLKTDRPEFETWLTEQNIELVHVYEVTGQLLINIDKHDLVALSELPSIDSIKLDKTNQFH